MAKQPNKLSERLRHAIEHAGITRYRLAQLSGVDESALCRFMAGRGMSVDNIDAVCEALELELAPKRKRQGR